MAIVGYWADEEIERDNIRFSRRFPTLDSLIAPDDPVRLFDEILMAGAIVVRTVFRYARR